MKYKIFAGICLLFICIFAGTSLYYKEERARMYGQLADDPVFVREHSRVLGNPDARVTIVEFMDPACETCAAFSPFIKKIMAANPDKIKLVIRYAPFHHGADIFVKMLEAAGNQDKYWETLAAMFRSQSAWASHADPRPERIWEFLPAVGLDINQLKTDMNDPEFARRIKQDMADADTLKVRKTPGFFVNGRPLEPFGRQPLLHLIQEELEKNY
tara:strand:- start:146 stop:787 length:642 start_codon:yes stop_codon:yes gene_type:complete